MDIGLWTFPDEIRDCLMSLDLSGVTMQENPTIHEKAIRVYVRKHRGFGLHLMFWNPWTAWLLHSLLGCLGCSWWPQRSQAFGPNWTPRIPKRVGCCWKVGGPRCLSMSRRFCRSHSAWKIAKTKPISEIGWYFFLWNKLTVEFWG